MWLSTGTGEKEGDGPKVSCAVVFLFLLVVCTVLQYRTGLASARTAIKLEIGQEEDDDGGEEELR